MHKRFYVCWNRHKRSAFMTMRICECAYSAKGEGYPCGTCSEFDAEKLHVCRNVYKLTVKTYDVIRNVPNSLLTKYLPP